MEAIKDLGTNGGGFFNANSAHPYENPNGFTNAFEILLVLCIPFGLAITFGRYARNMKQGIAIFAAMAIVLVSLAAFASYEEQAGNPALAHAGATWTSTGQQSGGNMNGKEVRFGAIQSAQFGASTTGTSTGAVDSSHDSWTPLGGLVPLLLIQLGEIVPGGVGSGLYGILIFAMLSVFIAGLMVGRTPEYLGKKIESREVKLAALAILALPASILGFTAVSVLASRGQAGPLNPGPHGFSEILYAFSSATGNNGSAFAGLTGNTLQHHAGGGDVDRTVDVRHSRHRAGRLDGQEEGRPRERGYLPHRHAAVHRSAHRGDPHRGGAHLLPGARAGTDPRAPAAPRRPAGGPLRGGWRSWQSPQPRRRRESRAASRRARSSIPPSWCRRSASPSGNSIRARWRAIR
jgi:hypothetical protein